MNDKTKIITIFGARPQFIKAASIKNFDPEYLSFAKKLLAG